MKDINLRMIFCLMLIKGFSTLSQAQESKSLAINDKLPPIMINNLVSTADGSVNLETLYPDGMLIINFWATWCVPCVREMEFLAKQVALHKGRLKVLSVSYEPRAVVENFLKKQPEIKNSALIIVYEDKLLRKFFFHQALPHNIWIDNKGYIKAITGGEEMKAENINNFLSSSTNKMKEKKDVPFDRTKPLKLPDSLIEFRATFSKQLPGVNVGGSSISPSRLNRPSMKLFFGFNQSILDLFWKAYLMPGNVVDPRFVKVLTNDSTKYFWPGENKNTQQYKGISFNDWFNDHQYTYELRVPKPLRDEVFLARVISDLEFNLDVHSYTVQEKRWCTQVRFNKSNRQPDTTKAIEGKSYFNIEGNKLILKNTTLERLLNWIVQSIYEKRTRVVRAPYVIKKGMEERITATIDLGADKALYSKKEHLEKVIGHHLGLAFKEKWMKHPILVIEDN